MLSRSQPIFRAASRLLRIPARNFCITVAYLNPDRHITMNHNPHNIYLDSYDIGEYPEVVDMLSQPPRTFEHLVRSAIARTVTTLNAQSKFSEQDLQKHTHRTWEDFLNRASGSASTFEAVSSNLLKELSEQIIVKESRWTWPVEQKVRLEYSEAYFKEMSPKTVQAFIDDYNRVVQDLVNISNLGVSREIVQAPSFLEQHYEQEMKNTAHDGVADLEEDRPENKSFINRLMRALHS